MEVEFLDAAPDDAPGEVLTAPGSRGRIAVVALVLAALVTAVLVARGVGGAGRPAAAGSSTPSPVSGSATVHSADAIRGATLGEAGQVALPVDAVPACPRSCTVALFVPNAVLDALYDRFPKALVRSQYSVLADRDRSLLQRRLTAQLPGGGRLDLTVTRRGVRPPIAGLQGSGAGLRTQADLGRYRVVITLAGADAGSDAVLRLATDRRLLATD